MNRTLERRVEASRSVFAAEIRKVTINALEVMYALCYLVNSYLSAYVYM